MKVLELFAGSKSLGKVANKLGFEVFSVDWKDYDGVDLVKDIEFLSPSDIPFIPDIIWGSPDCTTYTIAAISTHRNRTDAVSEYAKKCDRVNKNVLFIIRYFLNLNHNLKFYLENPRGMFRKMPFMRGIPRTTIWYCQYGDDRAKPTDIFSNNIRSAINPTGWQPRSECGNNNPSCKHARAPRGSKTGTQGRKNHFERSRIPHDLCFDILMCDLVATESI